MCLSNVWIYVLAKSSTLQSREVWLNFRTLPSDNSHPLLLFDVVKVQLPPLVPKDQASAGHWPDGFEKFGRKVKGNWRNWTENVVIIRFFYMKWLNGFAVSWLKVNIWRAKHKWFPLKTINFGWLEGPTFENPLTSKLLWSFLETQIDPGFVSKVIVGRFSSDVHMFNDSRLDRLRSSREENKRREFERKWVY